LPQYDQVAAPPFPSRGWAARRVSARLPQFPWDRLDPYRERAEAAVRHRADEIADLSVGTPVDPTPEVVQTALRRAAAVRLAGRPRATPGGVALAELPGQPDRPSPSD
jgi:aspartate/methionine/tyrosine aminotransferase